MNGTWAVAKRVLVVAQDAETRSRLLETLEDAGYAATPATGFLEAKVSLLTDTPDLLVTDVRLGEHNGLHLVILAHRLHPVPAAVVISGHDDPVIRADAERLGATFLLKAIRPEAFLEVVAHALDDRKPQPG